jgi:LPS O-antigen subunit length determinant protein (WzzB/FepE family)
VHDRGQPACQSDNLTDAQYFKEADRRDKEGQPHRSTEAERWAERESTAERRMQRDAERRGVSYSSEEDERANKEIDEYIEARSNRVEKSQGRVVRQSQQMLPRERHVR